MEVFQEHCRKHCLHLSPTLNQSKVRVWKQKQTEYAHRKAIFSFSAAFNDIRTNVSSDNYKNNYFFMAALEPGGRNHPVLSLSFLKQSACWILDSLPSQYCSRFCLTSSFLFSFLQHLPLSHQHVFSLHIHSISLVQTSTVSPLNTSICSLTLSPHPHCSQTEP